MKRPTDGYLTVTEAARYLAISTSTIYQRTRARSIPHHRFGRSIRFRKEELAVWGKARTVRAAR